MKPSKIQILYYFIKLRWSRLFSSNKVSRRRKKRWKRKLNDSTYYSKYIKEDMMFPLMNKSSFMEHFDTINTASITKKEALDVAKKSEKTRDFSPSIHGISVGLSSGTSGNQGVFLTNSKEKAIWVGAILDRVIGFSLKKRKVAFFLRANNNLYEAVNSNLLSFTFFDIKTSIEDSFEKLKDSKANILVAQPSVLMEIAKLYSQQNISPTFDKIISVAEVLEEDQKDYFKEIFECPINQVYQCTEGFLAYTCKHGSLHFNEDWLIIDKKYVDEAKTRFHPIITDYLRESQPIINYELNDIIQEGPRCSCGSKSTVIEKIEGRADDVFKFKINIIEVSIYPDFIRRAIILASDQIINYKVTLMGKNLIYVYLEVKESSEIDHIFSLVKDRLINMLTEFGVTNMWIEREDLKHDKANKFTRIKNEYSKTI